jgi:hypothetical protein
LAPAVIALAASGSSKPSSSGSSGSSTVSTAVSSGSSGSSTSSSVVSSGSHPAEADVALTKCALADNQFEGPEATVSVTNHSSKPSNYIVDVAFDSVDGKTQLDTGTALVNTLQPGQTATDTAASLKSDLRTSSPKFTCKVSKVTRFAS